MFRATADELLELQRIRELLFWTYAFADDPSQPYRVEEAGSGILIATEHGLTARHVTQAFTKFDPQFEARRRGSRGFFRPKEEDSTQTSMPVAIWQQSDDWSAPNEWRPRYIYQVVETDISVLVLHPMSTTTLKHGAAARYLPWQLLPPRVGSSVRVYGFPQPKIDVHGNVHSGHLQLSMQRARVLEIATVVRGHGFCEFPGFVIDRHLPPATSGGAVTHNGRLVGIFSGPDYVAALWPLAITQYPAREHLKLSFAEHLDTGVIDAVDWPEVKGRVQRRQQCFLPDCLREHVYLDDDVKE